MPKFKTYYFKKWLFKLRLLELYHKKDAKI